MAVTAVLFALWFVGLVAGQQLAFWIHVPAVHGALTAALAVMRRRMVGP